jgi:hypothetical protein
MAVGRRENASNQVAVRGSGARRGRRGRQPYSWLGVGALTVGVGIALVPGCGVAHADAAGAGGLGAYWVVELGTEISKLERMGRDGVATAAAAIADAKSRFATPGERGASTLDV